MRVALATCAELPHLDGDDEPLVEALTARGAEVCHPVWSAGDAPFVDANVSVIRSTWDYTQHHQAFVAWAERVDTATGGRLWNRASVVRWNAHKGYLLELEQHGVAVVPTRLLRAGSAVDVARLAREAGWQRGLVVKPAVSAGARDSLKLGADDLEAAQAHAERLLTTKDVLVQPFVPGIAAGELSLIFVAQRGALRFAHAVTKTPAAGDFRTQPEFRARIERVDPPAPWLGAAERALAAVREPLLYARVDLVQGDDGAPWLMELELIEPCLYLCWQRASAAALADAILARGSLPAGAA